MKRELMIIMHNNLYDDRKRYRMTIWRGEHHKHYNRDKMPRALEMALKGCKASVSFIVGDAFIQYDLEAGL